MSKKPHPASTGSYKILKKDKKLTHLSPKEYGVLETTKDMINPFKTGEVLKTAKDYYTKAIKNIIDKRKYKKALKKSKTYDI